MKACVDGNSLQHTATRCHTLQQGLIAAIKEAGMKVGIALKPKTPASTVFDYVAEVSPPTPPTPPHAHTLTHTHTQPQDTCFFCL